MAKKKKAAKKKAAERKKPALNLLADIIKPETTKKATKRRSKKKPIGTCFVMMPFKEPFNMYYQSIFKPAIKAADLEPVLASDLFRPSVIVADLWQMIQNCKVLLAELTTKNANVFYELGLAHAIGKPVILVSETMDDVPFDLQQLRVLLYDKDDPAWGDKLAKGITSALKETLASPIEAVPGIFRKKVKSQAPKQDAAIARIEALEQQMKSLRSQTIHSQHYAIRPNREDMILSLKNMKRSQTIITGRDIMGWARPWIYQDFSPIEIIDVIKSERLPISNYLIRSLEEATEDHRSKTSSIEEGRHWW